MTTDERLRAIATEYAKKAGVPMLRMTAASVFGFLDFPTPLVTWPEDKKLALIAELEK